MAIVKNASFTSSNGLSDGTSLILGNRLGGGPGSIELDNDLISQVSHSSVKPLCLMQACCYWALNPTLSGDDHISPLNLCQSLSPLL